MNEDDVRTTLRDAIGDSEYPAGLRGRVLQRLNQSHSPGHPRLLGALAGVLTVLIVVTLVYVRVHSTSGLRPPSNSIPSVHIPQSVLEAVHLTAAAALISTPNLSTTIGQRNVSLVGAYADANHTVLIFRALPATSVLGIGVWDETGLIEPLSHLVVKPDGYQYFEHIRAPHAKADGIAHLTITIVDPYDPNLIQASPARRDYGNWNFSIDLAVKPAIQLPVQRVIPLGAWQLNVQTFQLTPSFIYFDARMYGDLNLGVIQDQWQTWAVLLDPSGKKVVYFIGEGGGVKAPVNLTWWWPRPDYATTYTLRIAARGVQYTTTVLIPAPVKS
jgi:hypothetical protein